MEGAPDIVALNEEIKNESAFIDLIQSELRKVIVGQNGMVELKKNSYQILFWGLREVFLSFFLL